MAAARKACEGEAEGGSTHLHKRDLKRPGPQIPAKNLFFHQGTAADGGES